MRERVETRAPVLRKRRGFLESARRRTSHLFPPLLLLLVLLTLWEGVSASLHGERAYLLPTPQSVVIHGLLAPSAYHEILPSFVRTAELATVGLISAAVIGIVLAGLMYRVRSFEHAAFPYLVILQAMPMLAVAPLLAVAFGYSFFAKALVVVLVAIFPVPTSFLLGLRSVDPGAEDMFQLQRVSWWVRFTKLALPSAMPNLMTGLRISAGLAVIGAIVGEEFFQAGAPGLGMRLLQYLDQVAYNRLYACLMLSSLLGISFYLTFTWLSDKILGPWHTSARPHRR